MKGFTYSWIEGERF